MTELETVRHVSVPGTPYEYDQRLEAELQALATRVRQMRGVGKLTPDVLRHLRRFFRIRNIYNSNAIEGNVLDMGETRLVVEQGMTLVGKPLKDQAEAVNLAHALDYLEDLAIHSNVPITQADIRQIHYLILKGIDDDNAGQYRSVPVEISGSRSPLPEQIPQNMHDFALWLEGVSVPGQQAYQMDPLIAAAAAHAWFVYIHPFVDGNGRTARILMNLLLMRSGYPIAIVTREDRLRYYDALEETQSSDLSSLIGLISESVLESLEEWELAAEEQREQVEWAQSVVAPLTERERVEAQNEYEVWRSAMDLLKGYSRSAAELIRHTAQGVVNIYFKDFGTLEFEKYLSLRKGESAKRTWFFRVDFRSGERATRYLFFFGHASYALSRDSRVTLHIAREQLPYHYERLDLIRDRDVPDLVEIGYVPQEEQFVGRQKDGQVVMGKVEGLVRELVAQVIQLHFAR